MGYIYLVTNKINGMKYVGQSIQLDIRTRWNGHHSKKRTVGKILYSAYKKYGIENFDYKIICICFDEDTNKYEVEYIKKYNTVYPNGYNLLEGGNNKRHNEETKRLLSEMNKGKPSSNLGKKQTVEQKLKTSILLKNLYSDKVFSNNIFKKRNETRLKNNNITKTNEKISESLKDYYKNSIENGIKTICKKVRQYDLDGNFIKEYYSISDAAKKLNLNQRSISRACERINGTSGGYRWTKE